MAIANPRIHIICWICGCKDEMNYEISQTGIDDDWVLRPWVTIRCNNCSSLTWLEELIPEFKKY